jgi:hypothetical protein
MAEFQRVTKDALKDQLKKYRRLLGDQDFLGNISGNKEHLIGQYNKAVEGWIDKQKEQEARQSRAAFFSFLDGNFFGFTSSL